MHHKSMPLQRLCSLIYLLEVWKLQPPHAGENELTDNTSLVHLVDIQRGRMSEIEYQRPPQLVWGHVEHAIICNATIRRIINMVSDRTSGADMRASVLHCNGTNLGARRTASLSSPKYCGNTPSLPLALLC